MRVAVLLVMLFLAVGAAVGQDGTANDSAVTNDSATNDTATDEPIANDTPTGDGDEPTVADCIGAITLVGKDDIKWYVDGEGAPNPPLAVCASAPVTFTIVVPDDEAIPHNFAVQAPDAPATTRTLTSGDQEDYVWTTPESGSFTYICIIHGPAMSGTVSVGEAAAPPASGGDGEGDEVVRGPTVSLKQIAPQATCDRPIPASATRDFVGGPTVQDYVEGCVQTQGDEGPEAHPVDLLLPISFVLMGIGVVAVVWVHKSYKP